MKYLMFKVETTSFVSYQPIIFSNSITHKTMGSGSMPSLREAFPNASITLRSAGFLNMSGRCFGESETLKLKAHKEDSQIVATHDYFHGMAV